MKKLTILILLFSFIGNAKAQNKLYLAAIPKPNTPIEALTIHKFPFSKASSLGIQMKCFPTLTRGQITIELTQPVTQPVKIYIFDMVDRLQMTIPEHLNQQINFNISNLAVGSYFVIIKMGDHQVTKKITLIP